MKNVHKHFFELLVSLTEKDLHIRYKRTFLGFFWLIINPLLQMIVVGFVFRFFMKTPIANYNYYLFLGLLVWNFFSTTVLSSTQSIVAGRGLIKKAAFPYSVLPLSSVLANTLQLLAGFILFLIPVMRLNTFTIQGLPAILEAFALLLAFTIGLAMLLSSLNVKFRDTYFLTQAALTIWFYATPIVYTTDFIPQHLNWVWKLNPMTSVVQLLQNGLLNFPPPEPTVLGANIVIVIITTLVGIWMFNRQSTSFSDML